MAGKFDNAIMPNDRRPNDAPGDTTSVTSDEQSLIVRLGQGDEAALRALMDRHDALVRYTIFRTAREQTTRDPQWLDAVAGESWEGFIKAARRGIRIESGSIGGYLTGIARQQTISALRRLRAFAGHEQAIDDLEKHAGIENADPSALLGDLESLTALRECASQLSEEDKVIMTQLQAISQRRWVEAGEALGLAESTLRSRWARILDKLRTCVEKKLK